MKPALFFGWQVKQAVIRDYLGAARRIDLAELQARIRDALAAQGC